MNMHASSRSMCVSTTGDLLCHLPVAHSQVALGKADTEERPAGHWGFSPAVETGPKVAEAHPDSSRAVVARPVQWAGTLPGVMAGKRPPL